MIFILSFAAVSLVIDALEDMQLLITPKDAKISPGVLNDTKLLKILSTCNVISSSSLSSGKIPIPDVVDTCRDVLDIVLDTLELGDTSDAVLNHLEQLRFLLSQPHFQVCLFVFSLHKYDPFIHFIYKTV